MKHSPKGQIEIVGLLVIVVLLIVIGMVFLRFYLAKPDSLLPDIRQNIETTDMLNALMKYTFNGKSIGENILECGEKSDCDSIKLEIEKIIEKINKPGTKYNFKVEDEDKTLFELAMGCEIGVVSAFPLTKNDKFYEAKLIFC